jgi:hypothetical protein
MAKNTFQADIVLFGIDTGDAFALTCCIGEACVTAETKLTVAIYGQFLGVLRMVERRAVAVLAGDDAVQVFTPDLDLIPVALSAVFVQFLLAGDPVFYGLSLPLTLIGLAVEGIHETPYPGAEVFGDIEVAKHQ